MNLHSPVLFSRKLFLGVLVFLLAIGFSFYGLDTNDTHAASGAGAVSDNPLGGTGGVFGGTNVGGIPDGTSPCWNPGSGSPRNITFNATGLSGTVNHVSVSMTFGSPNHTWVGDITAVLIAPNGASHTVFGHTGATTATALGDSSDLGAAYIFTDTASSPPSGGWWQEANLATATSVMTSGTYRTTASGGAGATNPQPPTSMNAAFSGVTNANGTWTLRLTDSCSGDTGAVTAATLTLGTAATAVIRSRADFDGDGKTDLSVFRPSDGNWYLNRSTAGFGVVNWGLSTDIPTPADYDGDNKTDTAIFRPSTGTWWIVLSGGGLRSIQFGASGDIPVAGDYDGDHAADLAVFRPSTSVWYIQFAAGGTVIVPFGTSGDLPVRGDYDGDGSTDIGVYRPSTGKWWGLFSGGGSGAFTFGTSTDKPVPADYDGDNRDDIAVYRPSTGQWWIVNSSNSSVSTITFGVSTDVPVPGDYDGDGRDDQAVYRNGVWWVNRSTSGITAQSFGLSADIPVPSKYIP